MWRFKGGRYVPHERNFGLKTVERGDIDSGNVLYHSSHANLAQWGTTRCGDFRTIDALTKKLEVRWLNRTVVGVNPLRQNEMGHGQRADVFAGDQLRQVARLLVRRSPAADLVDAEI